LAIDTTLARVPVSVLVAVRNEAQNLPACLESLAAAAEVVVVDSYSTDGTDRIATDYGATLLQFPGVEMAGGNRKRNWALDTHEWAHEWVFIVDADERIPGPLWEEIRGALGHSTIDGYYIPFKYIFMGTWIRHCGWWPGYQLRLFRHRAGRYESLVDAEWTQEMGDVEVHERVTVERPPARLKEPLLHEDYRGLGNWIDKHNRYSNWEAAMRDSTPAVRISSLVSSDYVKRHRALRSVWVNLRARPLLRFLWMYIARRGVLDGRAGFRFSMLHAIHQWHVDIKVEELKRGE
jgi:glycosyltransferase involved in cell wall biosynthesis